MDFKNLCQKIDVDSLRARLPQIPALAPKMPQLKLPKSITKLKSRKIFRSSREDVNAVAIKRDQQQQQQQPQPMHSGFIKSSPTRISTISSLLHQQQQYPHIEIRIESEDSTYCSAHSIEDDYPSPREFKTENSAVFIKPSSPNSNESPDRAIKSEPNRQSMMSKLQKSYKDFSDFKFKHIFAKRTIVRKDNIPIDQYVERFDEERRIDEVEEEQRNNEIADNYRFRFKVSHQHTGNSDSLSSHGSSGARELEEEEEEDEEKEEEISTRKVIKSVSAQSGDESGMESSPPPHKPGIAGMRFARVRKKPVRLSVSDEETETELAATEEIRTPKALWSVKINRVPVEASPIGDERHAIAAATTAKIKGYKERLKRLTSYISTSHEESGNESTTPGMLSKLRAMGKNNSRNSVNGTDEKRNPTSDEEFDQTQGEVTSSEKPLSAIKQNFKRLQKSLKHSVSATDSPDTESKQVKNAKEQKQRRFKTSQSQSHSEDSPDDIIEETHKIPMQTAIASHFQTMKKSLKRKQPDQKINNTDDLSPNKTKVPTKEKAKTSSSLMKKLNYMRSRKQSVSIDEPEGGDEEADDSGKGRNPEGKFEKVRKRTMKRVNEKMQHVNEFFHRSQEHVGSVKPHTTDDDEEAATTQKESEYSKESIPIISRSNSKSCSQSANSSDNELDKDNASDKNNNSSSNQNISDEIIEEISQLSLDYQQGAQTSWTTRTILSESLESDTESEFPRVLIHQDNSDTFESTLIIAVTRPTPSPTPISPKITEILPEKPQRRKSNSPRPVEWIPNRDIISSFLEMTPPSRRKLSTDSQRRTNSRKSSVDSNANSNSDSDSWMPDSVRNAQDSIPRTTNLNSIVEADDSAWRVHSPCSDEKIYKTKSIDIFERNTQQGGVKTAFEDFEDELKNAPIVKIKSSGTENQDEKENISTGNGNAKGEQQLRQIGNSIESLTANFDESEEFGTDDDDNNDLPPSATPSPPPTKRSSPLPPLPQRRSAMRSSVGLNEEAVTAGEPPPLPTSKPPLPPPIGRPPPQIPERSCSMSRPSKPLVKTSSLRLSFEEQVQPADIGKVNKLISRFEQPNAKFRERPRIIARRIIPDDSDEYSDEDADNSEQDLNDNNKLRKRHIDRDVTPTPTNTPRANSLNTDEVNNNDESSAGNAEVPLVITTEAEMNFINNGTLIIDKDSGPQRTTINNVRYATNSRPNSEYGSPLEYPSSLIGSTESTPNVDRRQTDVRTTHRSRRSMTRDDDRFYSFDSDDENSYYSISSTGSNRYIVEL